MSVSCDVAAKNHDPTGSKVGKDAFEVYGGAKPLTSGARPWPRKDAGK